MGAPSCLSFDMVEKFLDKAYDLGTSDTRDLYSAWSESYDDEVTQNGYATPARVARMLATHVADRNTPILDYGCGTGLSGVAMAAEGFSNIDGVDITADMAARAHEKGCYRRVDVFDPEVGPEVQQGAYSLITAIGVIGVGAAPITVFDLIMDLLPVGGYFAFSFNDHALEDPLYETKVADYVDTGRAAMIASEYGPHLPGANLNSRVYLIQKK